MQAEDYNRRAKELVDYITEYLSSIRERRVTPDVSPGYMRELIPESPPSEPEDWDSIFRDIERVIMPGVVHWQSPHMHAYYPSLTSWPSMLGDMLADAINCIGFTWASSPACTELEMHVMDWLCKGLGLPSFFLHHSPQSTGGGILQSTVSESTLVALLAARKDRILQLKNTAEGKELDDSVLNSRLVAYASDQAHSSVEKAGLITLVKMRFLPTDEHFSLRGDTLRQAIQEDRERGLIPVMLCATLGTTGVCAFDNLSELGPVCAEEGLWLHVDAAYAGSAYFCPEARWSLEGIEYAHSFVFNPSKWMMVHFDCTAFWVKDKYKLQQTFAVDPVYLRHENSNEATDFMHWQIPLSRRFRSLKLWFVMRSFGLKNLQAHIRHGIEMAKLLESLVRSDPNFEVPAERHLGLVVFCLKGGNSVTQELLRSLIRSGTMYLIPADLHTKRIIRFTVTSQHTTKEDILRDWGIISKMAADLLAEEQPVRLSEELPTNQTEDLPTRETEKSFDRATGEESERLCAMDNGGVDPGPEPGVSQGQVGLQISPGESRPSGSRNRKVHVELWIDKDQAVTVPRRTARSLSCSSEPLSCTIIGPLSGCNSTGEPVFLSLKEPKPKPQSSSPGGGHLYKIPEKPPSMLSKQALPKLTKFYSIPSFYQLWVHCGRYQLCCPLKGPQTGLKCWSSSCQSLSCSAGLSPDPL
ncbi:histidine decarboxylase [Hypomesus transpacificus]|uniref:histidine decarboxylase n=1 Tax=Hypomesus transpacificus TaxID=137520 RepID=UPI001F084B94|nr:histidine decarboxylase [Hypomesus transpacificus]